MKITGYGLLIFVILLVLTNGGCRSQKKTEADLILFNGEVFTLEDSMPWARGIAIKGNKIIALLSSENRVERYMGPGTRSIDLKGKCVVPGFVDAHIHFKGFASQQQDIQLMHVGDDEELVKELKKMVPLLPKDEWIVGGQWEGNRQWTEGKGELEGIQNDNRWQPDRYLIDPLTPENPCFLSSYDEELYLANTLALKAAELLEHPVKGMKIDPQGKPTGLIFKASPAVEKIKAIVKPKSEERILNEYRTGLKKLREMGIVEIHDMIRSFKELERYLKLQGQGELTCRVWVRPWLDLQDETIKRGYRMGHHPVTGKRDHYLRLGGFKSANDGFLGSRGAMLFSPYNDRPDYKGHYQEYNSDSDTYGSLEGNPEVYYNYCKKAVENGFCVDSHAIGDRGISEVLDVLERIAQNLKTDMSMFRIIHAEIVQSREFGRMKALKVIAETNPSQIPDDMRWLIHRLGPEREKLAFPFRTFIDKGIPMNFGSDAPGNAGAIFLVHPKSMLNAAVNRTNMEGNPPGGWLPHHKITMAEAIRAYTHYGAYACMREDNIRGSLKPGKMADMVVIDRNIVRNDPRDVVNMKVLMTIVNGRIVFQ